MASNLNVVVTVDQAQLMTLQEVARQAQRVMVKAFRDIATEMRSTGKASQELTQHAEDSRVAFNAAARAVSDYKAGMVGLGPAATGAATALGHTEVAAHGAVTGTSAITRELIVMGHEAMQGRFSRIPGSMMVLAEHTGAVTTVMSAMTGGMWAAVAGAAALAGGFALLAIRASETETAMRGVYNAALLQGRAAADAEANARTITASLEKMNVGHTTALSVAGAIEKLGDMSDATRAKLQTLAPDLLKIMNPDDAEKAGELFSKTFGSTTSMRSFADANHLLTAEQGNAFAAAEQAKDAYGAQNIVLDALRARIGGVAAQQKQADDAYYRGVQLRMAGVGNLAQSAMQGYDQHATSTLTFQTRFQQVAGGTRPSEESLRANAVEQEYLGTLRERQKLQSDLVVMQQSLGAATSDAAKADLRAAIQVNEARQAALKAPGEASWATQIEQQAKAAADAAVTSAAKSGAQRQAITAAGARAEVAVYTAASHDMSRTEEERNAMAARAVVLHMTLVREDSAAAVSGAREAAIASRKSAEEVKAGYDEQIGAARGNIGLIEALETQKLAFLGRVYGQQSTEYKRALQEQQQALIEASREAAGQIRQDASEQESDHKADLDLELAQGKITKAQALQDELNFDKQVQASALTQLDTQISTLQAGTVAYAQAMQERHRIATQFGLQDAALLAKMLADQNAAAEKLREPYLQAFRQIGAGFNSTVMGLIAGTTTWQKAEQTLMRNVLTSFLDLTEQMLAKWLVLQLARQVSDAAADAVIVAQDRGAAGLSVLLSMVGLDSGTSFVPHDMVAQIHQGEMVIPRYDADIIRGGGGGHVFHYSPTINGGGPAMERAVRRDHEDFQGYVHNLMRNGQIALPGRAQKGT